MDECGLAGVKRDPKLDLLISLISTGMEEGKAIVVSTWKYVLGVFVVLGNPLMCMPSSG